MNGERLPLVVGSLGFVIGALLGMAGSFISSAGLRGLAWGIDGTSIIVASALFAVYHLRRSNDLLAAGFLVFLVAETLIVSGSAMSLTASSPSFGAGAGLWSAGLAMISASRLMPVVVRVTGGIASLLLAISALAIFGGTALTPLSRPLPFDAYPFLAVTLFGWAWVHLKSSSDRRAT